MHGPRGTEGLENSMASLRCNVFVIVRDSDHDGITLHTRLNAKFWQRCSATVSMSSSSPFDLTSLARFSDDNLTRSIGDVVKRVTSTREQYPECAVLRNTFLQRVVAKENDAEIPNVGAAGLAFSRPDTCGG